MTLSAIGPDIEAPSSTPNPVRETTHWGRSWISSINSQKKCLAFCLAILLFGYPFLIQLGSSVEYGQPDNFQSHPWFDTYILQPVFGALILAAIYALGKIGFYCATNANLTPNLR